jgi:hypothetical protein
MPALWNEGGVEVLDLAVDVSRDLELLDVLRCCLSELGVRAEVREHLMSLVVFRSSPGLPVCVFISGGTFYCWEDGFRRAPLLHVQGVAAELAQLANGTRDSANDNSRPAREKDATP